MGRRAGPFVLTGVADAVRGEQALGEIDHATGLTPRLRMRNLIAWTALLALAACATSPMSSTPTGRITEFGLYARGVERIRADEQSPSGQARGSTGFRLLKSTGDVPLALGTSFGFCYEVAGLAAGAQPHVVIDVDHPPITRPGGAPVTRHPIERRLMAHDGVIRDCAGYGFDHTFELVPGIWRFTVRVNGTSMLTQEFNAR